jgi:hypothetical protein
LSAILVDQTHTTKTHITHHTHIAIWIRGAVLDVLEDDFDHRWSPWAYGLALHFAKRADVQVQLVDVDGDAVDDSFDEPVLGRLGGP